MPVDKTRVNGVPAVLRIQDRRSGTVGEIFEMRGYVRATPE